MGGKGSGGLRLGAGRKSNDNQTAWLHGTRKRGTMRAIASTPVNIITNDGMIQVPDGIPDEQRSIWYQLAPLAMRAQTLTPATAYAFRQLCSRIVLLQQMEAVIAADGLMGASVAVQMNESGGGVQVVTPKAHDLLTKCMTLMQRVDQGMMRFRLAPMGKPLVEAVPEADPFAAFDGGSGVQ